MAADEFEISRAVIYDDESHFEYDLSDGGAFIVVLVGPEDALIHKGLLIRDQHGNEAEVTFSGLWEIRRYLDHATAVGITDWLDRHPEAAGMSDKQLSKYMVRTFERERKAQA